MESGHYAAQHIGNVASKLDQVCLSLKSTGVIVLMFDMDILYLRIYRWSLIDELEPGQLLIVSAIYCACFQTYTVIAVLLFYIIYQ